MIIIPRFLHNVIVAFIRFRSKHSFAYFKRIYPLSTIDNDVIRVQSMRLDLQVQTVQVDE